MWVALQDLKPNETHLEFYKRMFNIIRLILKMIGLASDNMMFVSHAAMLEACTRQLVGAQPHTALGADQDCPKDPSCGLCVCQRSEFGKNSAWDFIDPPIPPLTHAPNIRFDWRCLQWLLMLDCTQFLPWISILSLWMQQLATPTTALYRILYPFHLTPV